MTAIFLHGLQAWPPLAKRLLAQSLDDLSPVQAALLNHNTVLGQQNCFATSLPPATGQVSGLLLTDVNDRIADRLAFFAQGAGLIQHNVDVVTDGRPVPAVCYAVTDISGGIAFDLDIWRVRWEQIALMAADEAMSYFGTIDAGDLRRRFPMILARAAARQIASAGKPATVRSTQPYDSVEVLANETRHAGFFLTREYELRHPMFDGTTSDAVKREVFVATDAAIVLPYDPVQDCVLLVEQFRMGPYGRGDPLPWMLEPVAGRLDAGETPEDTARRECKEEAGVHLTALEHIASHYCSPGCSSEYFHCFLGLCDLPQKRQGWGGLDSEDEDIRTHILPFDQAMNMVSSGEADNGPLILCLLWLQRERERLRAAA